MDALELIKRDHDQMRVLLEQATRTAEGDASRYDLLTRIKHELLAHEQMEEQVLYPVLRTKQEAKDIVLEGYEEHHVANIVLEELYDTPVGDDRWGARLKVLKESIEHHMEEEEGEMFAKARKALDEETRGRLGDQMKRIKQEALATQSDEDR